MEYLSACKDENANQGSRELGMVLSSQETRLHYHHSSRNILVFSKRQNLKNFALKKKKQQIFDTSMFACVCYYYSFECVSFPFFFLCKIYTVKGFTEKANEEKWKTPNGPMKSQSSCSSI